jgi:peptidyl-prolyl cis-trans isomerase A (cyclophilin A)
MQMMISRIAAMSLLWISAVLIPLAGAQTRVVIETDAGVIEAVLDDQKAPLTVSNFLKYVDAGQYNGASFFRTVRTEPDNQPKVSVKINVIQADVNPEFRRKSFGAIPLERTRDTGLKHVDGALSMPRNAPDSATSGFSICIGDQPEMDFGGRRNPDGQGFAVFGRVTAGMEIVRKIHDSPTSPSAAKDGVSAGDQRLTPAVKILSIRRK